MFFRVSPMITDARDDLRRAQPRDEPRPARRTMAIAEIATTNPLAHAVTGFA
jgi:hypothetical protein